MKTKLIIGAAFFAVLLMVGMMIFTTYTSAYNQNVKLNALYDQKINERSSYYDNFKKIVKQKGLVAIKNDSSFLRVVETIMNARKDGQQVMWKWVQESNPAATYSEVSSLYKDLSRQIEADRKSFVELEKSIQNIVQQQDYLVSNFWNSHLFLSGSVKLKNKYKPITSTAMDEINKTSKDDNTAVFE